MKRNFMGRKTEAKQLINTIQSDTGPDLKDKSLAEILNQVALSQQTEELTKEEIKVIANAIDAIIKLKNPLLEAIDGPIIRIVLIALNKVAKQKLSDDWYAGVVAIIRELISGPYGSIIDKAK